jgi:hypothetical protein
MGIDVKIRTQSFALVIATLKPTLAACLVERSQERAAERAVILVAIGRREQHHVPFVALNGFKILDEKPDVLSLVLPGEFLGVPRSEGGVLPGRSSSKSRILCCCGSLNVTTPSVGVDREAAHKERIQSTTASASRSLTRDFGA